MKRKYVSKDSWAYKKISIAKIFRAMKEVGYEPWMSDALFKIGVSI